MKKFSASCRMYDPTAPLLRLTQAEYDAQRVSGTFDYGTKMWNVEQRCSFATTDVTELRAHLEAVHGNKKRAKERDGRTGKMVERLVKVNAVLPQRPMHPRWRGPSLKDNGKPFEPKALEPGAEVTWPAGGVMDRSGQVWCAGPGSSVWVIPDEPRMEHHPERDLVRFERALVVKQDHRGELFATAEVFWSQWAVLEDVA